MSAIRVAKWLVSGERKAAGYLDALGRDSNLLKLLVPSDYSS